MYKTNSHGTMYRKYNSITDKPQEINHRKLKEKKRKKRKGRGELGVISKVKLLLLYTVSLHFSSSYISKMQNNYRALYERCNY